MKRIKKCFLSISICVVLAINVNAVESSGVFVGLDIGAGEGQATLSATNIGEVNMKRAAAQYGGKVGYKYLLNNWFGLRGYGAIHYFFADAINDGVTSTIQSIIPYQNYNVSFLTYTANIDALFNLYDGEIGFFGAFVGIGLGGVSVNYDDKVAVLNENIGGFYADAKLGLRAGMQHHSIDFIATIPFTEAKKSMNLSGISIDAKFKKNYGISLGYNYTF